MLNVVIFESKKSSLFASVFQTVHKRVLLTSEECKLRTEKS